MAGESREEFERDRMGETGDRLAEAAKARERIWAEACAMSVDLIGRVNAGANMAIELATAFHTLLTARVSGPLPLDVDAMRANLHVTFNGGHHEEPARGAFHHGMDTVCNVLASYQKGEQTNGIR